MVVSVQHKRTSTAGKVPVAADFLPGQIILNTKDGRGFMKRDDNVVVELTTSDASNLTAGTLPTARIAIPTLGLNVLRSAVSASVIAVSAFISTGWSSHGDFGNGAPYIRGTAGGPLAIQDAAGTWWNLDITKTSNVCHFGATGLGSVDDGPNIQTAINLVKRVRVPGGTYKVTTAVSLPSGASLLGDDPGNTTFRCGGAANNVFTINGSSTVSLSGFRIDSPFVTRTGGWYVDITNNAANVRVFNFTMAQAFEAIRIGDVVGDVTFMLGRIDDTVATTGRSVRVGTGTGTAPVLITFDSVNFVTPSGARPVSHFSLYNCGDITLTNVQCLYATYNLEIAPGNSQMVVSVKATNSFFDQAGSTNIKIAPTGTGQVARSTFENCWIASAATHQVYIVTGASTLVDGIMFSHNDIYGGQYGIYLTGTGATLLNTTVFGNNIAGQSSVSIGVADCQKTKIKDNIIGATGGFAAVPTAINLSGTCPRTEIRGNDMDGSTTKIAGTWSGASSIIEGNIAYNPVGVLSSVSTSSSPWNYQSGYTSETIYLAATGGSIGGMGQQGSSVLPAATDKPITVQMGPNEILSVSFSGTLEARRIAH